MLSRPQSPVTTRSSQKGPRKHGTHPGGLCGEMVMSDPRLNSVHLDFPRRDDFRRAREAIMEARGLRTMAVEKHEDLLGKGESGTMMQNQRDLVPPNSDYWLMDQQGIYPLRVGVNTIGRLPDNDVVIEGP